MTDSNVSGDFAREVEANITALGADEALRKLSLEWMEQTRENRYTYNFTWLGRPVIQFPQDMVAMQEIIWRVKPDLIVETGIAHGGSRVMYASILALLGGEGEVLGIDIDIREHNRVAIESHRMASRIRMLQGSSTDPEIAAQVAERAASASRVLVVLDSNHTHEHVLRELDLYAPLVTMGSYLVVFDTLIEDMPEEHFGDRAWGTGNNP
jgi:cephalosporin hydroxylase